MRLPESQFVTLLLVAGLSSVATLTLCVAYIHTAGLPDLAGGLPPKALTPTASTRASRALQGKPVYIEEKDEIAPVRDKPTFHNWCHEAQGDLPFTSRILFYAECGFGQLVFNLFKSKVMVVLAILVNLFWHFLQWYGPDVLNPLLRNLSLGVLVLNMFYNSQALPSIFSNNPFMFSCVLMVVEASVDLGIEIYLYHHFRGNRTTPEKDEKFKIANMYESLRSAMTNLSLLFIAQCTLGLFYLFWLNNIKDWHGVSGWRWFIGLCLCNIAEEAGEAGTGFHVHFWLKVRENELIMNKPSTLFHWLPVPFSYRITVRMVMSCIVNVFLRRIILCTAPVLLGVVEEPIDFIKDCLAVFFVTKLDDLAESKELDASLGAKESVIYSGVKRDDDTQEDHLEDIDRKLAQLTQRMEKLEANPANP